MLGKRKQKNLQRMENFNFMKERHKIKIKDLKSFNAPCTFHIIKRKERKAANLTHS